jgi:hypothetical protein
LADLHDLFRGALGPGLHRLEPPIPTEELAETVAGHGWVVVPVDLVGVSDKAGLLTRFGEAGRFPDWFSPNWDALDDVLGDLSWLGPADGYLVALDGWDGFARRDRADADLVEAILTDAASAWADRGTPFVAVVSEG